MSTDFIGQAADERRKQEIKAAIDAINKITGRLRTEDVFTQHEILTVLMPAIVLDQLKNWGGCWGDECYSPLNGFVFELQKLLNDEAKWEEGEEHPEGLGARWSDPSYEKLVKPGIDPTIKWLPKDAN
jgi:hypothetical protein